VGWGGGGGAGPTVTCPPPSMRPIRHGEYPRPGGGGAPPPRDPASPPTTDPLPLARVATDRRRRHRHHARCQSPIALPRQSAEWAERGDIVCRASDPTGGGKSRARGVRGRGWSEGVRFGRLSDVVVVAVVRWLNARIQFLSGGGARACDPSSSSPTRQPAATISLSNSQRRTADTPTCKTAGRTTEDIMSGQRGGGDDVLRSENRCKIRIFTIILYTQAVDK
jgi:hypothetical protein